MASHLFVAPVEVVTSTRWVTVPARPASRVKPAIEPRYHRCVPVPAGGQEVTACHAPVPSHGSALHRQPDIHGQPYAVTHWHVHRLETTRRVNDHATDPRPRGF